jgi:hypothetical protein
MAAEMKSHASEPSRIDLVKYMPADAGQGQVVFPLSLNQVKLRRIQ